jgi:ubiquinone biosynthesis protein
MHLQLPTRFVLLDRAIATLGSVGMELYPDFNVFDVAKPYARELMIERFTPQRIARRSAQEARNYARMLKELPYQVHDTLEQARDGQIEVGFRHEGLDDLFQHMDRVANRLVISVIAGTGVIGSSLIGIFAEAGPHVLGLHLLSIVGFSVSALLGLWLAWGVIRSGRL